MRVAVSVGHDEVRQGAYSPTLDLHEWQWCSVLARQLDTELGLRGMESRIFVREPGGQYSEQMAQLCAKINDWQASHRGLVVGLHFNSTTEGWAGGCALHWPSSTAGRALAVALAAAASKAIGNRNRGAIAQDRSWNAGRPPLWLLQLTREPAVILEPFFGSNESDARAGDRALQSGELARGLADAIAKP
jgi:N-acetylmuramoyl-L-alanine amidase